MRSITRRQALIDAMIGAGSLALTGCGTAGAASTGSTVTSTWVDPSQDGQLQPGPGEPLADRLDLAPRAASIGVLATFVHLTDAHVMDASSPARLTFLDRLGPPFQSTFRPQESLTVQVLAGAAAAARRIRPDFVIQGGDLIDNDQDNELVQALRALNGGPVRPGSGPHGYFGVQSAFNPDPFYYRPDLDAPRHPGLLRAAVKPLASPGVGAPVYPVLGDHDALVAGEIVPTALTRSLAVGDRALWELPAGSALPAAAGAQAALSPDGPPAARLVDTFLAEALAGPTVAVPADPHRRELDMVEVIGRLRAAAGPGAAPDGERLDFTLDLGRHLRVIVLDLVRRDGGSGGLVAAGQPDRLERALGGAGRRFVVVVSHQPLASSVGGDELLTLLDHTSRVVAVLNGHTHRNLITPRPGPAGGYWQIATSSLIDFPQQARVIRVIATAGGGAALQTWMLDHTYPGTLGAVARQLSYLDAQGGRPGGFAGGRLDRNVTLYVRPV
jgi:3',5'-cyclic AMP phosphodiesterase CpdA